MRTHEEVRREISRLAGRREELKECPPRWRDEYIRVDAKINILEWVISRDESAETVESRSSAK